MTLASARQERRKVVTVGIALLVIFAIAAFFSIEAGNGVPGSAKTTISAHFSDVGAQLQNGAEVTINGDRTGQVTDITYQGGQAVVTMLLRGHHPMYADASASISDFALLGAEVIELAPGTKSAGALVGDIQENRTQPATDLENVLNVLTPPTRTALQGTLQQLGGGLAGQGGNLNDFLAAAPTTLGDVQQIAAAASSPEANLNGLLNVSRMLATRFEGDDSELTALLDQTNATLNAVNVDGDKPLAQTLQLLPATLQQANKAVVALYTPLANTQAAVATIAPGAAALGEATPDFRTFLEDAPAVLNKIPSVANSATPAVGSLTTTFKDLQPLAPRLDEALANALPFLTVLSPYGPDLQGIAYGLGGFTASHNNSTDGGNVYEHYARASFPVNFGALDLGDLNLPGVNAVQQQPRDVYPAPGQAYQDHEG